MNSEKEDNYVEWSEKVRTLMNQKGMNQKELSEKSGITESSVCRYLKGERTPRIDIIINFAKALDVNVDYLLEPDDEPYSAFKDIFLAIARGGNSLTEEEQEELIRLIRGKE